ncbi:hypothetical protein D3C86_1944200 [compost metagenome]
MRSRVALRQDAQHIAYTKSALAHAAHLSQSQAHLAQFELAQIARHHRRAIGRQRAANGLGRACDLPQQFGQLFLSNHSAPHSGASAPALR